MEECSAEAGMEPPGHEGGDGRPPTSSSPDMARRTSMAVALAAGLLAAGALAGCSVPGADDPADAAAETTRTQPPPRCSAPT